MPTPTTLPSLRPQTAETVFGTDAVTTGTIRPWDGDQYAIDDRYLAYGHLTHEAAVREMGDCLPTDPHIVTVRTTWALFTPHDAATCAVPELEREDEAADEEAGDAWWSDACTCDVADRQEYMSLPSDLEHFAASDASDSQPGALPVTWIDIEDA
jgi:hypothetical protein